MPFIHALILTLIAGTPLYEMEQPDVDAYVRELMVALPTFEERLIEAAQAGLGTPYADGPLGEGPGGEFDSDPLIDLSRVDCVTYMEQSIALASAENYERMKEMLQRIRYEAGQIDFEKRNHFFISDWIEHNPFCIEVTDDLDVPTKTISRNISRKGFFKRVNAPGLGLETKNQDVRLPIVPSSEVQAAESMIPSPSIIAFVGKVEWLFALHTGLFIRDGDGSGKLYHASSKEGKVVAVDLSDYVDEQGSRYLGIAVFRVTEPERDE